VYNFYNSIKIFNNFTVIHCIIANCTPLLMVMLQHLFLGNIYIYIYFFFLIVHTIENDHFLMIFMKIFNNFTVIHCIVAKFSSRITAVLLVILRPFFVEKDHFNCI